LIATLVLANGVHGTLMHVVFRLRCSLAVLVEDKQVGCRELLTVGEADQVGDGAVIDGGQDGQQVRGRAAASCRLHP
jgi:hypothetical protein